VKYWLHGNMLTFEGKKMSKSVGNSILPDELVSGDHALLKKGFHPMVVRFFMMQAHYRSTLDFSNEALEASEKGFLRLMAAIKQLESLPTSALSEVDVAGFERMFYEAMNDDFNSPILISHLFEAVKTINSIADGRLKISEGDKSKLQALIQSFVFDIMGLTSIHESGNEGLVNGLMDVILDIRMRSRLNKDWNTSDAIRDHLNELNIVVKDGKDGATWEVQ